MNEVTVLTKDEIQERRKAFEKAQRLEVLKKNQRRMNRKNRKFKW